MHLLIISLKINQIRLWFGWLSPTCAWFSTIGLSVFPKQLFHSNEEVTNVVKASLQTKTNICLNVQSTRFVNEPYRFGKDIILSKG